MNERRKDKAGVISDEIGKYAWEQHRCDCAHNKHLFRPIGDAVRIFESTNTRQVEQCGCCGTVQVALKNALGQTIEVTSGPFEPSHLAGVKDSYDRR